MAVNALAWLISVQEYMIGRAVSKDACFRVNPVHHCFQPPSNVTVTANFQNVQQCTIKACNTYPGRRVCRRIPCSTVPPKFWTRLPFTCKDASRQQSRKTFRRNDIQPSICKRDTLTFFQDDFELAILVTKISSSWTLIKSGQ